MLNAQWKRFKSGTDIRGCALDGVEGEPVNLTDEAVERMAAGFLLWLSGRTGKAGDTLTVSVGRDSRLSGPRIRDAVVRALTAGGARVLDCGMASTPAMFMTTVDLGCDGAIQLTASHHPYHRNGLKFFLPSGGLEGADITALLEIAQAEDFPPPASGAVRETAYMAQYAARLRRLICEGVKAEDYDHPLADFRIVVDAGNGAGGFYARDVLEPLGADVSGSQFLEPDGRFPNHIPNPENPEAMASVCAATLKAGADLGVIFDTDVDRAGCVGADGREINRNRLIAMLSAIYLEKEPGSTIVTDSVTSAGLTRFIEAHGGKHLRYRRGYKNVIDKAIELNREGIACPMGIETSGHCAFAENYFLDDGAYMASRLIVELAKRGDLTSLIEGLEEPAEEKEIRLKLTADNFRPDGEAVIACIKAARDSREDWMANTDYEGVKVTIRLTGGEGFFLARLSLHDPVLPINFESDVPGGVTTMAKQLYDVVKGCKNVDLTPLAELAR